MHTPPNGPWMRCTPPPPPLRRPCPSLHPHSPVLETWLIGVVYLKIWVRMTIFAPQVFHTVWHEHWPRILQAGLTHANVCFVAGQLLAPMLSMLLSFLCPPYFICKFFLGHVLGLPADQVRGLCC